MHLNYSEIVLPHHVSQPLHFLLLVAEDDSLSDGQRVIEIAEGVEFPLFLIHLDEELLDSL